MPQPPAQPSPGLIPLWIKIAYSVFLAVLIPTYWVLWGADNFLWFCDVALILLLPALWLENRLLISMQALAVLLPDLAWTLSFIWHVFTGRSLILDADYVFMPDAPALARFLTIFHVWLPLLLLWLLRRLGYDRRAWLAQSALAVPVFLISFALSPVAENINFVFGPVRSKPQEWMPRPLWLITVIGITIAAIYPVTHVILKRLFPPPAPPTTPLTPPQTPAASPP